jgi:lysozyme
MTDTDLAREWIKRHEGWRTQPYRCPAGKLTIGYGRNLEGRGITLAEGEMLLGNDIQQAKRDAIAFVGEDTWTELNETRRAVLIDMAFNLGLTRLRGFVAMRIALWAGNYGLAADHMLNSKWARQVGERARFLAQAMHIGGEAI